MLTVEFGESTISRTQVQLWYNRFKEGREYVNDDARLGRPSTKRRKWFWINVESLLERLLMMFGISLGRFYGCYRHETCGSEDCSRIAKFCAKTTSHGHRSGDVDDVQRRFRFAEKSHIWWRNMGVWLLHWDQSRIIPIGSAKNGQDWKNHVKLGQMWIFSSLFPSIAMASCIMNSSHKVVRSIGNTTLCAIA